jgi:hypothetical protein
MRTLLSSVVLGFALRANAIFAIFGLWIIDFVAQGGLNLFGLKLELLTGLRC